VNPTQPRPVYRRAYRFQFFLPITYNPDEGGYRAVIPEEKFETLHLRLTVEFPGLNYSLGTRPPQVQGLWLDPSKEPPELMPDICRLYDIVVEPDRKHREFFRDLLAEFLLEPSPDHLGFGQEAALLIFSRVEILYIERT
jgi:hypothetical protein